MPALLDNTSPPAFTPRELDLLRPTEQLGIAAWAERHMHITEGPLVGEAGAPTRWSTDGFPLQQAVVEAIDDRRWPKVFLLTAPQRWGKTEVAAKPVCLHAIEHRRVSVLYVAANKPLANSQWKRKFKATMEADPTLAALIPENPDDGGTNNRRDFTNGTSFHFAGSESIGALAGFTVPVVVCDDIQAYPAGIPGVGHPVDLAFARAGAYPPEMRTLVGAGTAGTIEDYLWRTIAASTLYCPAVPCLVCGTFQLIEFSRFEYPDDPIEALDDTHMRCANDKCDHHIVFDELPEMLTRHLWVSCPPGEDWVTKPPPEGVRIDLDKCRVYPDTDRDTTVAGFWCNAFYWPFGDTWGFLAADWLSRRGDPDKVKDFQQNLRVVPWEPPEEDEDALTVEAVAEHITEGYKWRTIPKEADVVTLTVDAHANFLYYEVKAWQKNSGSSWLVDAGTTGVHGPRKGEALTKEQADAKIAKGIRRALDDIYAMERGGWQVDGGGTRSADIVLIDGGYHPTAVGQFCLRANTDGRRRKWQMVRGAQTDGGMIWPRKISRTKNGYPFRGINVHEAKHELRYTLSIPQDQPGCLCTYDDHSLEKWHRHMVSEHFIELKTSRGTKKAWVKREGAGANHWWDTAVYGVAAAIAMGVKMPSMQEKPPPRPTTSYFANLKKKGRRR